MKKRYIRNIARFMAIVFCMLFIGKDFSYNLMNIDIFAANEVFSGQCGENLIYEISNGVLTISGTGDMFDYFSIYSFKSKPVSPFSQDKTITKVIVGDGVTSIGSYAFENCSGLSEVILSNGIKAINNYAFYKCYALKELTIPESVEYLGYNFLNNNRKSSLKKLEVSGNNKYYSTENNVLYDKRKEKLLMCTIAVGEKCVIPNTVKTISYGAFIGCYQLKEIIIPESVTSIENYAFSECKNLDNIVIPRGVSTLGVNVFKNCISLKKIQIPETVSFIHEYALNCCTGVSIYGYKGTAAYDYANQNNIPFVALSEDWLSSPKVDTSVKAKDLKLSENDVKIGFDEELTLRLDSVNNLFTGYDREITANSTNKDIIKVTGIKLVKEQDRTYYDIKIKSVNTGMAVSNVYSAYDALKCTISVVEGYNLIPEKSVTVSWYNGDKLIKTSTVRSGTVPKYEGNIPSDPFNINRTFLGWTKSKNDVFAIDTPEEPEAVSADVSYYAVYSNTIDKSNLEMINFVNQHILKAQSKTWEGYQRTSSVKDELEKSSTEGAQVTYSYLQYLEKVLSLKFFSIKDQYSANEYTAILLDMFMSVEGIEKAESLLDSSAILSREEVIKTLNDLLGLTKIGDVSSDKESYNIAKELYESVGIDLEDLKTDSEMWSKSLGEINDKKISDVYKKYNITDSELNTEITMYFFDEEVIDILDSVGVAISTVKDYIENINAIVAAKTLYNMGEDYRKLLNDIYDESKKYQGNSWEIKDLQNALEYQIQYHDEFSLNMIKESFKTAYEATDGLTKISGTSIGEMLTGTTVKKFLSKHLPTYINKIFGSVFLKKVAETQGIKAPTEKLAEAVVSKYLTAISLGITIGNLMSDSLFDLDNRNELYYKGKCYAVLEEILSDVINDKAEALIKSVKNEADIYLQYEAAVMFDKVYKMYMYSEANGLKTYSEYEKSFIITEWQDDDGIFEKIQKKIKNAGTHSVSFITSLIWGDQESIDRLNGHLIRSVELKNDSDFILKNCRCHENYNFGVSQTYDIFNVYRGIKISLICCPVQVNVYDEEGDLIGSLSKDISNISDEYVNYLYRIESLDMNVIIVPESYRIEIIGLDSGTMNIVSSYLNEKNLINGMYASIPVDRNFSSELVINEEKASMINRIEIGEQDIFNIAFIIISSGFILIGFIILTKNVKFKISKERRFGK